MSDRNQRPGCFLTLAPLLGLLAAAVLGLWS